LKRAGIGIADARRSAYKHSLAANGTLLNFVITHTWFYCHCALPRAVPMLATSVITISLSVVSNGYASFN
jgi:hypothetical protein